MHRCSEDRAKPSKIEARYSRSTCKLDAAKFVFLKMSETDKPCKIQITADQSIYSSWEETLQTTAQEQRQEKFSFVKFCFVEVCSKTKIWQNTLIMHSKEYACKHFLVIYARVQCLCIGRCYTAEQVLLLLILLLLNLNLF